MTTLMAMLLGLCGFGFYLHGLYPSVSVGDAGEFITAAWTLGVPHPPGFPIYTVLGHLFADILPFANPAYRLNLFSAATASFAVTLFALALKRCGIRLPIAAGCAAILLASPALTANARASEVFALNALFLVAIFFAAVAQQWLLAFFLVGLGAGNHQIILFVLPALVVSSPLVGEDADGGNGRNAGVPPPGRQWRPSSPARGAVRYGLFFLLGISIYFVLLIRAQAVPFLNVGQPHSLERLWRVITRADYGSLTLALGETPARTIDNTLLQLKRLLLGLIAQGSWLLLFVIPGLIYAWKHARRNLYLVGWAFLALGPGFFLLGNLPFDAQSSGLLARFLIAPLLASLFFVAWGLQWAWGKNRALTGILFCLGFGLEIAHVDLTGFRFDFTAHSYARNNLRTLPPHAQFIIDGGDDTFYTLAYLTHVENRRPDITLFDRGGVVFANPYGQDFRQLDHDGKELRRQRIEKTLQASTQPLYYSTMNPNVLPGVRLHQNGMLYAANGPEPDTALALWSLYDLRGVPPWDYPTPAMARDYRTRSLLPFYAYQQAVDLLSYGPDTLDQAWTFLKVARAVAADVLWLEPNLFLTGHVCAYNAFNAHQYVLAHAIYEWILTLRPGDPTAQANLKVMDQMFHGAR